MSAFKGFGQINGTDPSFSEDNLENGYVYFVRTTALDGDTEKTQNGYIYFNGKRYGNTGEINAGEY